MCPRGTSSAMGCVDCEQPTRRPSLPSLLRIATTPPLRANGGKDAQRISFVAWVLMLLVFTFSMRGVLYGFGPRLESLFKFVPIANIEPYSYSKEQVTPLDLQCLFWKTESRAQPCDYVVGNAETGACVLQDRRTRRLFKVMETSPGRFYQRGAFSCGEDALEFINFRTGANLLLDMLADEEDTGGDRVYSGSESGEAARAVGGTQRVGNEDIVKSNAITAARARAATVSRSATIGEAVPTEGSGRGIVMAAYDDVLPSAFASIQILRESGCVLPVELWSRVSELQGPANEALLDELVYRFNVTLRKVADPDVTGFLIKVYAVAESAFNELLFLDSDSIVARDPTFLFELPEFQQNSGLFWPDFWHPNFSIFDMGQGGLAWELFGLDFKYENEQESGQLLINKRKSQKAITLMLYYAQNMDIVTKLRAAWGDKDLFRFAFRRTSTPYHMVKHLPALAGRVLRPWYGGHGDGSQFCGQTMVQYAPDRREVFLHRNTAKINDASGRAETWDTIQRHVLPGLHDYNVTIGPRRLPATCWYLPHVTDERGETVSPVYEPMPFKRLEHRAIELVTELDRRRSFTKQVSMRANVALAKVRLLIGYKVPLRNQ